MTTVNFNVSSCRLVSAATKVTWRYGSHTDCMDHRIDETIFLLLYKDTSRCNRLRHEAARYYDTERFFHPSEPHAPLSSFATKYKRVNSTQAGRASFKTVIIDVPLAFPSMTIVARRLRWAFASSSGAAPPTRGAVKVRGCCVVKADANAKTEAAIKTRMVCSISFYKSAL